MDLRLWQWRSPWEKRTYLLYFLFYLCLLLREHVTAADAGYRQESEHEVQDSANKLDSLSNYLPYYTTKEDSDYYDKRGSSSAFFPLRGKKPYSNEDSSLITSPQLEDKRSQFYPLRGKKVPDDLKRGSSYFMPMRGRKDGGWTADEDYDVTDENPYNKRASSFMPMRGKKKYSIVSDYLNRAGTYPNPSGSTTTHRSSAQRPNDTKADTFVSARRRKRSSESNQVFPASNEDTDHSARKRSVAFMPMRGRRESAEGDVPGSIATSLLEKKEHPSSSAAANANNDYGVGHIQGFDKRAVFVPMRGRRFSDEDNDYDSKRARTFMPMRGRRTAQLRDVVFDGSAMPGTESRLKEKDKRASPSFMPMRDRKSHSEDDFEKRASAFTPMRGRRSVENKVSPHKRAPFVPMRGRRLAGDEYDVDFQVEPWQADQLMSLLDKKSYAFVPMRGRRFFAPRENFTVDPWPAEQLMSLFSNKRATFVPMRGRRRNSDQSDAAEYSVDDTSSHEVKRTSFSFVPMRGRREMMNFYSPYPYLMAGIGSSLMSKPHGVTYSGIRSAEDRRKKLLINWDAVKRAFHATRGKRVEDFVQSPKMSNSEQHDEDESSDDSTRQTRRKRSIVQPRVAIQPRRQYIALKRPMSFFATRGKRLDDSAIDKLSTFR